jgi:hypothetical protein
MSRCYTVTLLQRGGIIYLHPRRPRARRKSRPRIRPEDRDPGPETEDQDRAPDRAAAPKDPRPGPPPPADPQGTEPDRAATDRAARSGPETKALLAAFRTLSLAPRR